MPHHWLPQTIKVKRKILHTVHIAQYCSQGSSMTYINDNEKLDIFRNNIPYELHLRSQFEIKFLTMNSELMEMQTIVYIPIRKDLVAPSFNCSSLIKLYTSRETNN